MNFFTFFAILAVFIVSSESFRLEENGIDDRIVGGDIAWPGQFPHTVSLRKRAQKHDTVFWRHICTGSILNHRWILSAAQCTPDKYPNISNLAIAAGGHPEKNDTRIYYLDRIVNHPAYDYYLHTNDISLLRTNDWIQFTRYARAIPISARPVGAGANTVVVGWENAYKDVRE